MTEQCFAWDYGSPLWVTDIKHYTCFMLPAEDQFGAEIVCSSTYDFVIVSSKHGY